MNTNRISKIALLLVLPLMIAGGCKKSSEPTPKPDPVEETPRIDVALQGLMAQYLIPSISFAVIRNEKLVYLKAYGTSDKEAATAAKTTDLYRIASISKPITLAGILKLVQDGKISFDQKVFGPNGILGNDYGVPPANSNIDQITVKHLVQHRSGWNNTPNDPMFVDNDKTHAEIISGMISGRPLASAPGSTEFYLNFGYLVLGRVIEKVSGQTYENYIKTNILSPAGITGMRISGNTLEERASGEVKYYYPPMPYQLNVRRMDAAGGWLASVTDLARFMVRVDRKSVKPDILSQNTLNLTYFGYDDWYHFGSLPGTTTIVERLNSTTSYVILLNTRVEGSDALVNDLRSVIKREAALVEEWPETDLF